MAPPKNPGTPRAQQNKPGDVSTPLADLCISGSSPSDFEEPPARSTRSHRTQIFRLHEWAQLEQEQQGKERQEVEEQEGKRKKEIEQIVADIMAARQRARAGHSRDGTVAVDEEHTMFNKIVQDLTKCKEKNEKQAQLARQIDTLNKDIAKKGNKPTLAEIDNLDSLQRQLLRLSEDETRLLNEEPADIIKNLEILIALRSASEADVIQPRNASGPKSRNQKKKADAADGAMAVDSPGPSPSVPAAATTDKVNRVKGSFQRSASVSSTQTRLKAEDRERDSVAVKVEDGGAEGVKSTSLAERDRQFFVGAEVVFRHNKKQPGTEGDGIQCIIKGIIGDGPKKKYDVQDPEPNEAGKPGATYRTSAAFLIPIPQQAGSSLPTFEIGKQVLARYPDTTTFYRAEVMGVKKEVYRLKFEGEEDDKEMDVDRRFVLDVGGK